MDNLTGQEVYVVAQEPDVYTDDYYSHILGIASDLVWATHYVNEQFEELYMRSDSVYRTPKATYKLLPFAEDGPTRYKALVEYAYTSGPSGTLEYVCFTITRYYINK